MCMCVCVCVFARVYKKTCEYVNYKTQHLTRNNSLCCVCSPCRVKSGQEYIDFTNTSTNTVLGLISVRVCVFVCVCLCVCVRSPIRQTMLPLSAWGVRVRMSCVRLRVCVRVCGAFVCGCVCVGVCTCVYAGV